MGKVNRSGSVSHLIPVSVTIVGVSCIPAFHLFASTILPWLGKIGSAKLVGVISIGLFGGYLAAAVAVAFLLCKTLDTLFSSESLCKKGNPLCCVSAQ